MKKYFTISLFAVALFGLMASSVHAEQAITSTLAFTFTKNLSIGAQGNDVKMLQQFLNKTPVTSTFGPLTLAAVKNFQKEHGVPATGFVGPLTRVELNKALALSQVALPTIVSMSVDMSVPNTAHVVAKYDGSNEKPTVWFAYGATPSSMTILSQKVVASDTIGTTDVTISNIGTTDCFVQAYIQNSVGTTRGDTTRCTR